MLLKRSLQKKGVTKNSTTKESTLFDAKDHRFWRRLLLALIPLVLIYAALVMVSDGPTTLATNIFFLLLSVLAGIFNKQIALVGHEIGHKTALRGAKLNLQMSRFLGSILGVSHTWWRDKHNIHHSAPNRLGVDTDIEFPIIIFDVRQAAEKSRWAQPILRNQHILFIPLLMLQAVNTQKGTITYLLKKPEDYKAQAIGVAIHWLAMGTLIYMMGWPHGLVFFAVKSAVHGLCNGSVFAPNHKGEEIIEFDAPKDRLRDQIETARNIEADSWIGQRFLDWWCDGLQYQGEHHLFPTMPMDNLATVAPIVRSFCEERGIKYSSVSFGCSILIVMSNLKEVAYELRQQHKQQKLLAKAGVGR